MFHALKNLTCSQLGLCR